MNSNLTTLKDSINLTKLECEYVMSLEQGQPSEYLQQIMDKLATEYINFSAWDDAGHDSYRDEMVALAKKNVALMWSEYNPTKSKHIGGFHWLLYTIHRSYVKVIWKHVD